MKLIPRLTALRQFDTCRLIPSRFADLYERHFERVYAYAVHRVRDRDAAEDLTAEVFHKALASLPRYEWRGAPFGARRQSPRAQPGSPATAPRGCRL